MFLKRVKFSQKSPIGLCSMGSLFSSSLHVPLIELFNKLAESIILQGTRSGKTLDQIHSKSANYQPVARSKIDACTATGSGTSSDLGEKICLRLVDEVAKLKKITMSIDSSKPPYRENLKRQNSVNSRAFNLKEVVTMKTKIHLATLSAIICLFNPGFVRASALDVDSKPISFLCRNLDSQSGLNAMLDYNRKAVLSLNASKNSSGIDFSVTAQDDIDQRDFPTEVTSKILFSGTLPLYSENPRTYTGRSSFPHTESVQITIGPSVVGYRGLTDTKITFQAGHVSAEWTCMDTSNW